MGSEGKEGEKSDDMKKGWIRGGRGNVDDRQSREKEWKENLMRDEGE